MSSNDNDDATNGNGEALSSEKKELPFWVGDVHFLTLNEKKKLWLGGPEGLFAGRPEDKAYLAWLRQEQIHRAKCAHCGKTENLKCWTNCEIIAYCNVDCQRAHRKKHRQVCKKPNHERFKIDVTIGE